MSVDETIQGLMMMMMMMMMMMNFIEVSSFLDFFFQFHHVGHLCHYN